MALWIRANIRLLFIVTNHFCKETYYPPHTLARLTISIISSLIRRALSTVSLHFLYLMIFLSPLFIHVMFVVVSFYPPGTVNLALRFDLDLHARVTSNGKTNCIVLIQITIKQSRKLTELIHNKERKRIKKIHMNVQQNYIKKNK